MKGTTEKLVQSAAKRCKVLSKNNCSELIRTAFHLGHNGKEKQFYVWTGQGEYHKADLYLICSTMRTRVEYDNYSDVIAEAERVIPQVLAIRYYPMDELYVPAGKFLYANPYSGSTIVLDREAAPQTTRPALWQEFLDRWFNTNIEEVEAFEAFLANMVHNPMNRAIWMPVLRTEGGIGKGVLLSEVLRPLMGKSSVQEARLERVLGSFNASFVRSRLVVIQELPKATARRDTYNQLKDFITDDTIQTEEKFEAIKQLPKWFNTMAFTNKQQPIKITDEEDRRLWVPEYIRHKVDMAETKAFLWSSFVPWLEKGDGLNQINAWLHHVNSTGLHGVDMHMPPETAAKLDLMEPDTQGEALDLLSLLLERDLNYRFQIDEIRRVPQFNFLSRAQVRKSLEEHGYIDSDKSRIASKDARGQKLPAKRLWFHHSKKGMGGTWFDAKEHSFVGMSIDDCTPNPEPIPF